MAVDMSVLDSKLCKSSSRVSAPDFFVFGEPIESDIPSLKEEVVPILSA